MEQLRTEFEIATSEDTLQQVAEHMRERNIEVVIVNNGKEARQVALERIPHAAEVHSAKSKTLQKAGIFDAIIDPLQYNALRHQRS
jgi:2-phospho-L-lactate transferase/gluconeogenesis factor (CofD/UPF0052 family)